MQLHAISFSCISWSIQWFKVRITSTGNKEGKVLPRYFYIVILNGINKTLWQMWSIWRLCIPYICSKFWCGKKALKHIYSIIQYTVCHVFEVQMSIWHSLKTWVRAKSTKMKFVSYNANACFIARTCHKKTDNTFIALYIKIGPTNVCFKIMINRKKMHARFVLYNLGCFVTWGVRGRMVKIVDFKQLAPHRCGFESRKGLWILSCEEALPLAYGTSMVLLRWPFVPLIMHRRAPEVFLHQ
jgi:hypothetical protein